MRLHERVLEIQRMVAHPDITKTISHAKYWADCEAAFDILRKKGYGQPEMSIADLARLVPEAS